MLDHPLYNRTVLLNVLCNDSDFPLGKRLSQSDARKHPRFYGFAHPFIQILKRSRKGLDGVLAAEVFAQLLQRGVGNACARSRSFVERPPSRRQ